MALPLALVAASAQALPPVPAPLPRAPLMCVADSVVAPPTATGADAELVLGARTAWSEGRLDDARALLSLGIERFPGIADHLQVMLGEIELEAGDAAAAKTRFESAIDSVSPSVRLEARVGRVRALVELGAREADAAVRELLEQYPELPDRERLAHAEAVSLEQRGRLREAVAAYRSIDLDFPGSVYANEARGRLAALLAAGVAVAPLTPRERVDRAERLTSTGPVPAARGVVDELLADASIQGDLRRTAFRLAVRIARVEGRFSDVDRLEREMREEATKRAREVAAQAPAEPPTPAQDDAEANEARADDDAAEAELDETEGAGANERQRRARSAISRILHHRTLAQAPAETLDDVADHAAGAGLDDTLRIVVERAGHADVPATVRFHVAMAASGRPSFEPAALALLQDLGEAPPELATGARYHRARLLERLSRLEEARAQYTAVLAADRSSGHYYSMWASQRVAVVDHLIAERAAHEASPAADGGTAAMTPAAETFGDAGMPTASNDLRGGRTFDLETVPEAVSGGVDLDALSHALDAVAAHHSDDYPWIGRAASLLRVRAVEEARSELFEALVAHRVAAGRSVHRYGLEAVSRGVSRPTRAARSRSGHGRSRAPRVTRRPLDDASRSELADVAAALGDHGTAIAFGGEHTADDRPRAFDVEVLAAARKFDVDPNLLWAVMRVESVYQPRIVSYAGAIGLMQIMPRTGRLIAQQLGHDRFTTAQLLDPATNLEFAAWYLHSLIDRFDGHVPLAVAAYNGGPHNVRLWLERSGPEMPLDAFLERIPFDQTHRYVRRVLTHYAVYRERDGLPMIDLGIGVPEARADTVAF